MGLVAFLMLAGIALDRAFARTAENNLSQRLKSYAMAYADNIDFGRDGSLYTRNWAPTRASTGPAAASTPRW